MNYCDGLDCESPANYIHVPCRTTILMDVKGETMDKLAAPETLSMSAFRTHIIDTIENGVAGAWARLHNELPDQVLVHPETGLPDTCALQRVICRSVQVFNTASDPTSGERLFQADVVVDPFEDGTLSCYQVIYNPDTGRYEIVANVDLRTTVGRTLVNLAPESFSASAADPIEAILRVKIMIPSIDPSEGALPGSSYKTVQTAVDDDPLPSSGSGGGGV